LMLSWGRFDVSPALKHDSMSCFKGEWPTRNDKKGAKSCPRYQFTKSPAEKSGGLFI